MKKVLKWRTALGILFLLSVVAGLIPFVFAAPNERDELLYAEKADCALVLTEYTVPDYHASVKIYDPNGKEITPSANGRFRLLVEGEYRIVSGGETFRLASLFEAPQATLSLSGALNASYSSGEVIDLPALQIGCDYNLFYSYGVDVFANGERQDVLTGYPETDLTYMFNGYGNYRFEYYVVNLDGERVALSAETTVENEKKIFADALPDRINLGESLDLGYPYGYYDGTSYNVTVGVRTPQGNVSTLAKSVYTPESAGDYEFTYRSEVAGEEITVVQTVSVEIPRANFFFTQGAGKVEGLTDLPAYAPREGKGLLVRASSANAKFTYGGIVDLSALTKEDNLLEFLAYSEGESVYMNGIKISFTDVYDAGRSFTVYYYRNPWGYLHSYLCVAYENAEYGISNETATFGELRKGYGASAYYTSFMPDAYATSYFFNVQYDSATETLYFVTRDNANPTQPKQLPLLPLSDSSLLPADYVFRGFTTGEVYVSFEFLTNNGSGIYLTELAGVRAEDLNTTDYADNFFVIESESLPNGVVGYDYRLPNVKLSDLSQGSAALVATVRDPSGREVPVDSGKISPTVAGVYSVEYSIEYAGFPVKKTLPFEVLSEASEIRVESSAVTVRFGEYLTLPEYTVTGGTGKVLSSARLTLDGTEVAPAANGKYLINGAGVYRIEITATDFVGYTVLQTFDVTVTAGVSFEFPEPFPKTVKAGASMCAPTFEAAVFDGSTVDENPEKSVIAKADGVPIEIVNQCMTIPQDCASLTLTFRAGGFETEKRFDVLPKTVTDLLQYLGGVDGFVLESGIVLPVGADGTAAKLPYALSADGLVLSFGLNDGFSSLDALEFVLTDPVFEELTITLRFFGYDAEKRTISMSVGGGSEVYTVYGTVYEYSDDCGDADATETYAGKKYVLFDVEADTVRGAVMDRSLSVKTANLKAFDNGLNFAGFSRTSCFLSFSARSAAENAELILSQIGNHYFNYYSVSLGYPDCDPVGPEIVVYGDTNFATVGIGSVYTVPAAAAFDVLSGSAEVTVTVRGGGVTLLSAASCAAPQIVTLGKYGLYSVIYEARDVYGNVSVKTLQVKVKDEIPPVIRVSGAHEETVRVGQSVKIADYTATDGEGTVTSAVFLKDASLKITFVSVGESVVFGKAGEYEIVYLATDDSQNVARVSVRITVK